VDGVTADIPAGAAGERTLLRFFSTASETHVPVLQGRHMTIHAEDGLPYTWQDGVTGTKTPAPREQWSVMLPPLKTADAIITPASETRLAVYDGNGYMTNPSDINDYTVGDTVGGMLRFLSVATAVNTAPVADAQAVTTAEDTPVAVTLTGSDLDGDTLTYSVTGGPTNGTLSGTAPNLTYTPNANYNGADSFTFVVNDGTVDSAAATVSITVTPVNDAPVAADDAYTTSEDIALTVAAPGVLVNDTDVDVGDTLTAALVSGSANGTVVLASNGAFVYTPNANFNGSDTFTYVAFDSNLVSNQATVTITVTPVNDVPVVTPVADQTSAEGASVSLQVTATDGGDGGTLVYSATGLPPDLTIDSASGLISGTVAAGVSTNSPYSVTVSVSDGIDTTAVSFQWTVTAVVVPTDTLYFSTTGNTNPPGVTGTADDADIYRWDGTAFSRVVDASAIGVPANGTAPNVDGLVLINPTDFYVSFTGNVTLTGLGTVQDEDIVRRNNGAWSVYFDGTGAGLREDNQDIDAFDIVNGIIYFSTFGNLNPPGVTGTADDADIYRWNGGTSFTRVVDVTAIANPVPVGANVDALKFVSATEFYLSFTADVTLPGLGAVQDEDVVKYTNGSWSVYFDGTAKGLTSAGHDIDAVQLP
jgi:VCBS repeat-containing protein